jgi:hypothetical protein
MEADRIARADGEAVGVAEDGTHRFLRARRSPGIAAGFRPIFSRPGCEFKTSTVVHGGENPVRSGWSFARGAG